MFDPAKHPRLPDGRFRPTPKTGVLGTDVTAPYERAVETVVHGIAVQTSTPPHLLGVK